jgi:hypothetical protein
MTTGRRRKAEPGKNLGGIYKNIHDCHPVHETSFPVVRESIRRLTKFNNDYSVPVDAVDVNNSRFIPTSKERIQRTPIPLPRDI